MPMLHCHPHALRSSIFHTNHNTNFSNTQLHALWGTHPCALMGTGTHFLALTQLIQ